MSARTAQSTRTTRTGTSTGTSTGTGVLPKRTHWNAAWERERWYRVPGHGWRRRPLAEAERRYAAKFARLGATGEAR